MNAYSHAHLHRYCLQLLSHCNHNGTQVQLPAAVEARYVRQVCWPPGRWGTLVPKSILPSLVKAAILFFFFFLRFCLFVCLFRDVKRREKQRGRNRSVASHLPSSEDLAHNPGMCPHQESNWRIFSAQAGSQSTEPHQPGQASSSYRDLVGIGEGKLPLGSANLLCWWQRAVGVGRAALDMRQCSCCSQYGWPW